MRLKSRIVKIFKNATLVANATRQETHQDRRTSMWRIGGGVYAAYPSPPLCIEESRPYCSNSPHDLGVRIEITGRDGVERVHEVFCPDQRARLAFTQPGANFLRHRST